MFSFYLFPIRSKVFNVSCVYQSLKIYSQQSLAPRHAHKRRAQPCPPAAPPPDTLGRGRDTHNARLAAISPAAP
jgi:hypothetical protein